MRFFAIGVALVLAACSFCEPANAGYSRRAQMSGYDATYHSTGRCFHGKCQVRNPHSRHVPHSHKR
jgi:hypothetical protein